MREVTFGEFVSETESQRTDMPCKMLSLAASGWPALAG